MHQVYIHHLHPLHFTPRQVTSRRRRFVAQSARPLGVEGDLRDDGEIEHNGGPESSQDQRVSIRLVILRGEDPDHGAQEIDREGHWRKLAHVLAGEQRQHLRHARETVHRHAHGL